MKTALAVVSRHRGRGFTCRKSGWVRVPNRPHEVLLLAAGIGTEYRNHRCPSKIGSSGIRVATGKSPEILRGKTPYRPTSSGSSRSAEEAGPGSVQGAERALGRLRSALSGALSDVFRVARLRHGAGFRGQRAHLSLRDSGQSQGHDYRDQHRQENLTQRQRSILPVNPSQESPE